MISQPQPGLHWLRELAVPALMLVGIGLFVADSLHLSIMAMVLPAALIAVVIASLIWALASVFLSTDGCNDGDAVANGEDEAPGPILNAKPWLIVALPALLFGLLDYLGAFTALVALVFGAQLMFDARAPIKSFLIAIAVTAPTYALFKYVLYVRFPAGVLGLG
jgi:hypothetical protein